MFFFLVVQSNRKMEVIDPPFASTAFVHFRMHGSFTEQLVASSPWISRKDAAKSIAAYSLAFAVVSPRFFIFISETQSSFLFERSNKPWLFLCTTQDNRIKEIWKYIGKVIDNSVYFFRTSSLLLHSSVFIFIFILETQSSFFFQRANKPRPFLCTKLTGIKEIWKRNQKIIKNNWNNKVSHGCGKISQSTTCQLSSKELVHFWNKVVSTHRSIPPAVDCAKDSRRGETRVHCFVLTIVAACLFA